MGSIVPRQMVLHCIRMLLSTNLCVHQQAVLLHGFSFKFLLEFSGFFREGV